MRTLIKLDCTKMGMIRDVLVSTTSEALDIWSIPGVGIPTHGGGTQVFLPLPLETRQRLLDEGKIVEDNVE